MRAIGPITQQNYSIALQMCAMAVQICMVTRKNCSVIGATDR
jgi:hypothetical protein